MQTKLIELLNEKNMKYQDIANILKISKKQAGFKIKGKAPFKGREMFVLSNYFGLPIEDIFLNSLYQNGTKNE